MNLALVVNMMGMDIGGIPFAFLAWGILIATTCQPVPQRMLAVSATLCVVLASICAESAYLIYTTEICDHLDEYHNETMDADVDLDKLCHLMGFLVESNGLATILWLLTAIMVWKFPESKQLLRTSHYESDDGPSPPLYHPLTEMEFM